MSLPCALEKRAPAPLKLWFGLCLRAGEEDSPARGSCPWCAGGRARGSEGCRAVGEIHCPREDESYLQPHATSICTYECVCCDKCGEPWAWCIHVLNAEGKEAVSQPSRAGRQMIWVSALVRCINLGKWPHSFSFKLERTHRKSLLFKWSIPWAAPLSARCYKWDLCCCHGPMSPLLRLHGGWLTCFQDSDSQCLRATSQTPALQKQRHFAWGPSSKGTCFPHGSKPAWQPHSSSPRSWLHKPHPWCLPQSGGELLQANWELCIFSFPPAPACQEGFLQHSTGICDDAEQSVSLGCLEKWLCLGQISSFSLGNWCPQI